MNNIKVLEEIDLNITSRCNIGCKHCIFSASSTGGDDLSFRVIKNILIEGKKLGAREVHISGGEPTVRKDYIKILQSAHDLGYFVRLQTNLFSLPKNDVSSVLKYSDEILTSLDGLKKRHDFIRKPGSFDKTLANIRMFIKEKKRIIVVTSVQNRNIKDIPNLVEFLISEKINAHFLFSVTPIGRAKKKDVVPIKKWGGLIASLHSKYKGKIMSTDVICELRHLTGDEKINFKESQCRLYTRNHALVLSTGEIFPCSMFTSTDKSLGNVNKKSFGDIWKHSPTWTFYSQKINDSKCSKCKLQEKCHGGCPGYSYIVSGNITNKDPRCQPGLYPVCPSWKLNIQDSSLSLSTWKVMKR